MKQVEKVLEDLFKPLPQLPEPSRKALAQAMPWITLLGGVLALYFAYQIYQLASPVANPYLAFGYSVGAIIGYYGPILWVSLALLVLQAVLFLVAFPALRTGKKSGWNLLFWAALANGVYNVAFNLFSGYVNVGQLIFGLIGTAIGLYFLFQVRSYFGGAAPAVKAEDKK